MEVTRWKLPDGSYPMEVTRWKLPDGTDHIVAVAGMMILLGARGIIKQ